MRAAKTEMAKHRAWLGVTALGMLAFSLAVGGAPIGQSAPGAKDSAEKRAKPEGEASATSPITTSTTPQPATGAEPPITKGQVRAGQIPDGEFQVIANVVVDYRDDDMTRARDRGELVGPLPIPSRAEGVAAGGCTYDVECDDSNRCTIDTCNIPPGGGVGSGKCEFDPVPDGFNLVVGGCNDDYCTGGESCQGAVCAAGSQGKECDGGSNDGERCVNSNPDCPGGSCVTRAGLTCDSHDDCRAPGVCNVNTGQCTSGGTGACASNFDCGTPGTGSCNPGVCTAGQAPTCCTFRSTCLPEFATCSEDSDNAGESCDTDAECQGGGRCNRCMELCASATDCDDKSACNGVETCTAKLCRGGSNNGNTCTSDANCPKQCAGGTNPGASCTTDTNCTGGGTCEGKCLGTCGRGVNPCGFGGDCDEGHCSGGTRANSVCSSNAECPGGYCTTRCIGGPTNGVLCGICPGGTCCPIGSNSCTANTCVGGANAGRPCLTGTGSGGCDGDQAVCGSGRVCYPGRCCTAVAEPVCTQGSLVAIPPNPLCTGGSNWYSGDGGRENITTGQCGGAPTDQSEAYDCPKYSSGFTQTSINSPPQRLVTVGPVSDSDVTVPLPNGPGGPLNKLGDDYALTNNSYIGLDVMRWVGGPITAADRIIIEFYDGSNTFNEDIVLPGIQGTEIGIIIVRFQPPLTISPTGSVVARVASAFSANTRFVWVSTNAAAAGTNDANKIWVNNGPVTGAGNFLGAGNGILAFELAGDKTAAPTGACCAVVTNECVDGILPWICVAQGGIFNGLNSKCAECNGGPQLGNVCRKCVGGLHVGLACTGDAVCGECSQAGTQPCLTNADCGGANTCTTGNCATNDASCPGSPTPGQKYCYYNGVINPNQTCTTAATCTTGSNPTCEVPKCVESTVCGSGACCNPTTGNCAYPSTPGACDGTCPSGTCVGGVGAGLPCSTAADCKFFQGFGTTCDADDRLSPVAPDPADQHCCRQPNLGQKCMGGPVMEGTCDLRCVNGTNPGTACPLGTECTGGGTCTGTCTTGNVGATCTVANQATFCDLTGNNMQSCTTDANCRECSGGPFNGTACTVHANCARCRGGTNNNGVCVDDDDCPGEGVCVGHCLGVCGTLPSVTDTRNSGADNCADAVVHQIAVPSPGADPITVTISGNNVPASSTVENPDSCFGIVDAATDDPGWWEAFHIDDCAWVRLDFCCTDPTQIPAWAFLAQDCDCVNTLANTANPYHFGETVNFRGAPYCNDNNLWQSYGPLPAGTYYYPIYSVLAGNHGDYQMHITVMACPEAACCHAPKCAGGSNPGTACPLGTECTGGGTCETCTDGVHQTQCDALGGLFLAPPQLSPAQPICVGDPCETGSCCVAPGDCLDQESDLDGVADDDDPMTRAVCLADHPGATFIGGTRCAGGTCIVGGTEGGESCRIDADCGFNTCLGSTQEKSQKNPCPVCEHTGNSTCDNEGGVYVWLSDASALNNPTRQCNDIMPAVTGTFREMCVLGHYIGFPGGVRTDDCEDENGGVTDSFTVRLYAPDPTRYFPGALLGEWATSHFPAPTAESPRGVPRNVANWGNANFYDFQLTLIPTTQYPLVQLQEGQIYFLEMQNNTTGGMPECNFYQYDAGVAQGNDYAFLDACGTTYTEDSVKLFVTDPTAMRDPAWCINVPYNPPPSPVRACCTGDPLNPCVDLTIRECAEIAGDWQFGQLGCSGYICPVEPNNVCANARIVNEGEFEFNMYGATQDGAQSETCTGGTAAMGGDIWYFYQATSSGEGYIGTCDCERGGDEVVAVYHNPSDPTVCPCPGDIGMTLIQCNDSGQDNYLWGAAGCLFFGDAGEVVLKNANSVVAGNCYTVRVATFQNTVPARANLRIAVNPAVCGNGIREVAKGGEQCDPGEADGSPGPDDDLCPGECAYNCLCPPPVCGKQCVGGTHDSQPCSTLGDCPGGTACQGKVEPGLGEECDVSAGVAGTSPCTTFFTTCRLAGDPEGECTCVPVCGNGRREGLEVCDGQDDEKKCVLGTNIGQPCNVDADCPPGAVDSCEGNCGNLPCGVGCRCETVCGNGQTESGEQCDPGGVGGTPPPEDDLCSTRCIPKKCSISNAHCTGTGQGTCPAGQTCVGGPDACTCPPAFCGNNYTEIQGNDEECDGTDLAGESICPGEPCRPPGDPAGECTCACAGAEEPPNTVVWDPTSNPSPWPNSNTLATTRSLRFTVTGEVGPSKLEAIKVTMVDLQHPRPANLLAQPPPNFTTYDTRQNAVCVGGALPGHHCDTAADCPGGGTCPNPVACTADPVCPSGAACTLPSNTCARWVGKLGTFLEFQDFPAGATYKASRLQCTPFYHDWKPEGLITVVGAEILPSSEYSVQTYGASCMGEESACTAVSPGVTMYTRRSGDTGPNFNPPATSTQPDALDVAAVVNKAKQSLSALVQKSITQLQPNLLELNADVSALDISNVVDAVRQVRYAFSGPCPCPSTVTCGATACPAGAGVCVTAYGAGATCVKTCAAGVNAGEPCINNTHCPGSTCGTPLCRDRCGRCKP